MSMETMAQEAGKRLTQLIEHMRDDSQRAVILFLDAAEHQRGGELRLQAPTRRRSLPEAGYATEQYLLIDAGPIAS